MRIIGLTAVALGSGSVEALHLPGREGETSDAVDACHVMVLVYLRWTNKEPGE